MEENTLLLVEDSHIQAKIIRQRFEGSTGFNLLAAYSLAEAKAITEESRGALFVAVTNLNLPDAPNGEIVDFCLEQRLPCVVLTASFDENLRKRFLEKRVADYFLKGGTDDLDPLIAAVLRLHANRNVAALVAGDSSTQRGFLRQMLAAQCIRSAEAADGAEALEQLRADPDIQLVIIDFERPRLSGLELARHIRARRRLENMAVICLSSAGSGPLTAKFLKYGASDFLTKPFEPEEFYWRVNQVLHMLDCMAELKRLRKR